MNVDLPQLSTETWNAVHLLTVPEIALWARVHPKTVYRWIKAGQLDAIQFGSRTYRVPEPVVVRFMRQIGLGNLPKPDSSQGEIK